MKHLATAFLTMRKFQGFFYLKMHFSARNSLRSKAYFFEDTMNTQMETNGPHTMCTFRFLPMDPSETLKQLEIT